MSFEGKKTIPMGHLLREDGQFICDYCFGCCRDCNLRWFYYSLVGFRGPEMIVNGFLEHSTDKFVLLKKNYSLIGVYIEFAESNDFNHWYRQWTFQLFRYVLFL